MKLLVGFVGRKRTGKDTLAKYMSLSGDNVDILSFADPLKQACKNAFQLTDEQLDSTKDIVDTRWGVTPRDMMKSMGTEYFRSNDPEHWIKVMEIRMSGLEKVVIPDVRFKNEAIFIKNMGGILIHVSRDLVLDDHQSETESDEIVCDYSVYNDGTLEELKSRFSGLFHSIPGLKQKMS